MPEIRLATWNINSVRLRAAQVRRFLRQHAPDVLCLQEIKCPDEFFPRAAFHGLGYVHQAVRGQKGYHGVAIVSRLPFRRADSLRFCDRDDCRHVSVVLEGGLEIHSLYVPAGGDIPDEKRNEKFRHKLAFLREMTACLSRRRRAAPVVLVGDLNVAPLENDVWNHRQMLDVVSHTPVECELLNEAAAAGEWIDVTRAVVPHSEKIFSWWSYRARDWEASDRGRRLDHIWISPALEGAIAEHAILRRARGWARPSDHVPVTATLRL